MKLIFHLPENKVHEFSTEKSSVIIGRGTTCDIILLYDGFSRQHAKIELENSEIFVTDLNSTNGVFINGQKIPSSVRTSLKSFLNLQIGPAHQVEILDDAKPMVLELAVPRSESTRSRIQKKTAVMSIPEKKSSNTNQPLIVIVALLMLGGIFYFFKASKGPTSVSTNVSPTEVSVAIVSETAFLSSALLESLDRNKSCAGEQIQWCQDAGIIASNKEGVVIEGKSLLVYMNMTSIVNDKYSAPVEALNQPARLEILLLRRIFNSVLIRSLSRQTLLDNVQIVGGVMEQGQWQLKLAVKIRRDIDLKKADKFFMYELFDQILNQGRVERLSEISSLYEKLPL